MPDEIGATAASAAGAGGAQPGASPSQTTPEVELLTEDPRPQAAAKGAEPDEDDDPDDSRVPYREDPHYKSLRNSRRNLQRKLASFRAKFEGVNVDELRHKAQSFDELNQTIQSNARLRELLYGQPAGKGQPERETGDDFDPSSFPFDQDAPGSAYLLEQAKTVHGLRQQLVQTQKVMHDILAHLTGRERQDVVSHWRTATEEAAKRLPDKPARFGDIVISPRELFERAVLSHFQEMNLRKERITKERAQQVISHYLRQYVTKPGGAQPSPAEVQRAAERSTTWPRTSALAGGGTPAPAKTGTRNIHQLSSAMRRGEVRLGPPG